MKKTRVELTGFRARRRNFAEYAKDILTNLSSRKYLRQNKAEFKVVVKRLQVHQDGTLLEYSSYSRNGLRMTGSYLLKNYFTSRYNNSDNKNKDEVEKCIRLFAKQAVLSNVVITSREFPELKIKGAIPK